MTTTTGTVTLTEAEFASIKEFITNFYARYISEDITPYFNQKFNPDVKFEDGEALAEAVRDWLWYMFTGGGVSARATIEAFATIGKADWCRKDWC